MTACPDPTRLRVLLAGDLPPGDQADLTAHLDGCPACRVALERLAGGANSWADLRGRRIDVTPPDGPLQRAIDQLAGTATVTDVGADTAAGTDLPPLGPPTRPGALGRFGPFEVLRVVGRGG